MIFLSPFRSGRPAVRVQRQSAGAPLSARSPQFAGKEDDLGFDNLELRAVMEKMHRKIRMDPRTLDANGLGLPFLPDVFEVREKQLGKGKVVAPNWTTFPRPILDHFITRHENDLSGQSKVRYVLQAAEGDRVGFYQMTPAECDQARQLLGLPPLNKPRIVSHAVIAKAKAQYQKNPKLPVHKVEHEGELYIFSLRELQLLDRQEKSKKRHFPFIPLDRHSNQ